MSQHRFRITLQEPPPFVDSNPATAREEMVNAQLATLPLGVELQVLHGYDLHCGYFVTVLTLADARHNGRVCVEVDTWANNWLGVQQMCFLEALQAPEAAVWIRAAFDLPY